MTLNTLHVTGFKLSMMGSPSVTIKNRQMSVEVAQK